MKRLIPAAILAVSSLAFSAIGANAATPLPTNAQRALQWLECTQQQPTGQIGSGGNPVARSSEVALGLAAAGQPASAMHAGALTLADYLKTAASTDVGTSGELLLARVAQPGTGATATLIAQLQLAKSRGEYGADLYSDSLAILGLRAAGQQVGADAVKFLQDHQAASGAWSYDGSDKFTDSNTTAIVVLALISAGVSPGDGVIVKALDYLASTFGQGGFGYAPGAAPDGNSDELVIQAILAVDLSGDAAWQAKLTEAVQNLASQQAAAGADAGAINGFSKLFATTFAPSAFLVRPITAIGLAEQRIALLPCPATSAPTPSASAAPQAAATPAARLAQTGAGAGHGLGRAIIAAVLLLLGTGLLRRRPAREPGR